MLPKRPSNKNMTAPEVMNIFVKSEIRFFTIFNSESYNKLTRTMIGIESSNLETSVWIINDHCFPNLNPHEERLVELRVALKEERDGEGSGVDWEGDVRG